MFGDNFLFFWASINLPRGNERSHKKSWPDQFISLDVYWNIEPNHGNGTLAEFWKKFC